MKERSLLEDIKSITKGTKWDWAVDSKHLEPIINDIVNGMFSPYGESLALEAYRLWLKTQDRETVQSLLMIAHDIEIEWRQRNQERSTALVLASTSPYETISFVTLTHLTLSQELSLKAKFRAMSYKEFLRSVYWKTVRLEVLKRYRFTCHKCMAEKELEVNHLTYANSRGMEHRNLNDMEVLCSLCHLKSHMDEPDPGAELWGEVGKTVKVKQL